MGLFEVSDVGTEDGAAVGATTELGTLGYAVGPGVGLETDVDCAVGWLVG